MQSVAVIRFVNTKASARCLVSSALFQFGQTTVKFALVASDYVSIESFRSVKADAILESVRRTGEVEMLYISKVSATEQRFELLS